MAVRLVKIALLANSAVFLLLVVFNNLTDYGSNLLFVENVLNMSTTFEGNRAMWRAIEAPWVHHAFYASIILWESVACLLVGLGAWTLWKQRRAPAAAFEKAKRLAVIGLGVSLLQWYFAFLTVGAEWFLMWQSETWNGQDAAARMFLVMGVSLVFLNQRDREPEAA